jgi:hypothetical protein
MISINLRQYTSIDRNLSQALKVIVVLLEYMQPQAGTQRASDLINYPVAIHPCIERSLAVILRGDFVGW